MLLPRGNPAAVRDAGKGVPNRACATDWPSGDNRIARSARVNGDERETASVGEFAMRHSMLLASSRFVEAQARSKLRRFDILTFFSDFAKTRLNFALLGFDCFYNAA
jgi:hypothetical protein